jgi:hypothetical protein
MKKIINLLLGLSLCLNSYTQTSQLKSFDKEIFKEDFNSKNAPFHINSDKDNYMVIDDGDLFVNRTNPSLAQAVFSKNSIETTAYRLKTAIKAGPSTKRNSYSGIVINSPLDSKEMESVNAKLSQEIKTLKLENTDYQRIKKEYGITQALLDKSNAQLKKKTDKIVSMKKKSSSLLELQRELSDLKSKNSKLTTQLNALNSKHEKLENNEKSILNSLAKYSTQNKNLNKSLNTAQLKNESLKINLTN